ERGKQRIVGCGLEEAAQQSVEIGTSQLFRGDRAVHRDRGGHGVHADLPSFITETSSFADIMSTTRQSAHICRRRRAPSPANIEWPVSLPIIDCTICFVPKALPQETQWNGS